MTTGPNRSSWAMPTTVSTPCTIWATRTPSTAAFGAAFLAVATSRL